MDCGTDHSSLKKPTISKWTRNSTFRVTQVKEINGCESCTLSLKEQRRSKHCCNYLAREWGRYDWAFLESGLKGISSTPGGTRILNVDTCSRYVLFVCFLNTSCFCCYVTLDSVSRMVYSSLGSRQSAWHMDVTWLVFVELLWVTCWPKRESISANYLHFWTFLSHFLSWIERLSDLHGIL